MDGTGKGIKDPAKDVLIADSAEKTTRGKSFGIVRMLDTLGSVVGPLLLFALLYFLKGSDRIYHYILLFAALPLVVTLIILVLKVREPETRTSETIIASSSGQKLPRSFYIFLAITILFTLGNSSDAFLILRAKNLGMTLLEIPLVIAFFNLVYAATAVPLGILSDKIGRIPTMFFGWTAYAIVYLGFALATNSFAVWFLYGFYGIYYATSQGVAKAFLADMVSTGHRGKAFGIYGTVVGITTLPASFFGGFLWDTFGPQAPFYFGASMAITATILLAMLSRQLRQV